MFDNKDVNELVGQWKRGEAHGTERIKDAIKRVQAELVERSGGVPIRLVGGWRLEVGGWRLEIGGT